VDGFLVLLFGELGLWYRDWLDEGFLLLGLLHLHLITRSKIQALCEERSELVML